MDIDRFQDPPKQYREIPFWSWNDALDPAELRRQIGLIDEAGLGGFFMHSRVGLKTPYMGKRWMESVKLCIEEARRRGMGAWLYDEDKWPSGFAGGLSVSRDPSYRMQYLVCKVDNRPALLPERIATFAAREVDGRLTDIRAERTPAIAADDDRLIQFYTQSMGLGLDWFNGYAYLSLLNPQAVRAFLDSTHEVYARAFGDDFGATIPGIFSDEPSYMYRGHGASTPDLAIPWSADFPAYFRENRGYDLLPHLPALYVDMDGCRAIRYDYWRTVTELFVESYTRQIYTWADEHSLQFTGHMMAEDTLLSQVWWAGAAMAHYPYFHVPGIDKLGRAINEGPGTILTAKQLDSAACQLGKERTLCENYGCGGQDFAHTGRKWIGDWAYVLGITLNNLHLAHYSLRGERKRDYPQVLFYQQPWWPENKLVSDYFARLSYALSQGRRVVDILVIHPIGSAWAVYRPGASREVDELDRPLNTLLLTLMNNQRDFHLGDELLMEPGGACEARVDTTSAGPLMVVGKMAYRVVIIPPAVTLAANTVRLLAEFAAAGGTIMAMDPLPALIGGRPAQQDPVPAATRRVTPETLAAALDDVLPFDVRVANRPKIWVQHRRIADHELYFLANTDLEKGGVATISLRSTGRLEQWDPATGNVRSLSSRQDGGMTEVTLNVPPAGSHLLVLYPQEAPVAVPETIKRITSEIALDGAWSMELKGANALTLDTAEVKIGDAPWSMPMHILDAHGIVAASGAGSPFALRFSLTADVAPAGATYLAVESPERFSIAVNGHSVSSTDEGWWVDTSWRRISLGDTIRAGRNEIVLRGVFAGDSELESVYVLGDFAVFGRRLQEENRFNGQVFDRYTPDFRLAALPHTVQPTEQAQGLALDLTQRGLAFFAGRVVLQQTLSLDEKPEQARLSITGLRAAVAQVRVNGKAMGAITWQPHEIDITEGLTAGTNTLELELVGTLRNLLGPHHLSGGERGMTGPGQFRDKSRWTTDYVLVPFGFDGVTVTLY